ncbi:MAG: thioredoxin family protein [Saprospiraceae bacterium]
MTLFKNIGCIVVVTLMMLSHAEAQKSHIRFQLSPEWQRVLKQARKAHKFIFFDGYTSWCGPCKRMDKEVFTRPAEARFFNEKFINVKYDMEKGEGAVLKRQYGITAFPTYLFINSDGQVLHRIVGAYFGENEFMNYAKMVLTFNGYYAALEKRYNNGERNPKLMFQYLTALRLAGEQKKEYELAERNLRLMSKDHFMDADYWAIINQYLVDPASPLFAVLLENKKEISAAIGADEVAAKIFEVFDAQIRINTYFHQEDGRSFDEEKEDIMITLLRKDEFFRSNELLARALCARHRRHGDWDLYASVVDAMYDFDLLKNNENPLREFDYHAAVIAKSTHDERLLSRALRWSEYVCETATRPEELAFYLRTKSKLQALLGQGVKAAETEAAARAAEREAERLGTKKEVLPAMKIMPAGTGQTVTGKGKKKE